MILENLKRDVETSGVIKETVKMSISSSAQSHIVKILTEYAYADPLGSGIREAVSNSLDSLQEANVNTPAIVKFRRNSLNQLELSFIDQGLGLSKEEFEKYIMGIGESTKRNNPLLRGGYGSGSKNWLGYVDSFNYICIKDGWERKFLIFKGEDFPESTMVYERESTAHNGVTVSLIVPNYDESKVIKSIKEQCSYFKNVHFDIPGFNQSYQLLEADSFQWNTLNTYNQLHISLMGVYYPIDLAKLKINSYDYPAIALRFEDYSDIRPNFTRESIKA